jgi:hypothetical protein
MTNIDRFVKRWYELHKPIIKDPDGNNISIWEWYLKVSKSKDR